MATERATQRAELPEGRSSHRHPLRRASDSTLLVGPAKPLVVAGVAAVVVGSVMAFTVPSNWAPLSFTLSSVVAVGLLGGARRVDTSTRPDYRADRSPRTRRVLAAVLILAVVGTAVSAWTIAADLAR